MCSGSGSVSSFEATGDVAEAVNVVDSRTVGLPVMKFVACRTAAGFGREFRLRSVLSKNKCGRRPQTPLPGQSGLLLVLYLYTVQLLYLYHLARRELPASA